MKSLSLESNSFELNEKEAVKIAVAKGDGIGPEIMDATLRILDAAGARIEPTFIDVGEAVYLSGNSSGITPESWDVIRKNKIILKSPITTPQGKGYKSLNVTMRKSLGLFANVRPVMSLSPYVQTYFPTMDVVVIRENEEDLYAGIEHQQTQDVVQCLKLITRPGCEKIVRYAFEYAKAYGRKKVTCMLKDNIMKLTDGLFHKVFDEIGELYPAIEKDVQIIDIATARLATRPADYDVVVTSNLYGDIVSDVAAEMVGSVGMAGSANIGKDIAMFEAIHGSAPDIAGMNVANPSGLLNGAVMMLAHIGQSDVADKVKNAWLATIESGYHTQDIFTQESKKKVSTEDFADEVIARLGMEPEHLKPSRLIEGTGKMEIPEFKRKATTKKLVGVDVFLDWPENDANKLGKSLEALNAYRMKLKMITNRGVKVYPDGLPETFCTDHWRCRFVCTTSDLTSKPTKYEEVNYEDIVALLSKLNAGGFDVIKTENLYKFGDRIGFSLGQGE
ncbi:NADP-dependent isocitrate dehydrogenase [Fulvivirga sp. M361]|uniref:NADP-dependent isocitrate dehydrogenase n=1 Tax=Fulvivirga sp. M361 TaxID=2594266 RepID=UPI001179BA4A|nr:NADP-dependent isocitrate dehydrogenase [Fulvivirga sp. M361]TRX58239.1 NADP-dependent isocitrate dehydrogenase [Fulvivirga sp. M361]